MTGNSLTAQVVCIQFRDKFIYMDIAVERHLTEIALEIFLNLLEQHHSLY